MSKLLKAIERTKQEISTITQLTMIKDTIKPGTPLQFNYADHFNIKGHARQLVEELLDQPCTFVEWAENHGSCRVRVLNAKGHLVTVLANPKCLRTV